MSEQKREKLTATTPEKTRPQPPLVQLEGKLTEEQLEAIGASQCAERNRRRHHSYELIHN